MKRLLLILTLVFASMALGQSGKPVKNVTDADATGAVHFSSDTVYVLNGFVYVDSLSTLTIEPGTVIKGKPGTGTGASALIIARGGKIYANGTATNPIIFTAESDDVDNLADLPATARGLWGGVIMLGNASINVAGGQENIEGIPTTELRGIYGGTNDDDNSGVFRYVSIRYGGTEIGAANEINGLTMGGVGRGTTIEFVEVFNNKDDGYEWFGGTVNTKYLISAFNGDDGFDYDEGWRGKNQFWFLIQDATTAGSGGEHDGGTTPEDGTPFAIPVIYNATYIGSGASSVNSKNDFALNLRDNAGGKYYNSIFTDFFGRAAQVEDLASGEDSRARLEAGDLVLKNNIWYGFGKGNIVDSMFAQSFLRTYMNDANNNNQFLDPMLSGISRTTDGGLDPRPAAGSPALSGATTPPADGFFTPTDYLGAFKDKNWAVDWTFISQYGILSGLGGATPTKVSVRDSQIPGGYELSQNYPNPFNPSTTINFSIPAGGTVSLKVFDMIGREVETLVDSYVDAGSYSVSFDASRLSSGMYFYRIQSGSFSQIKKMMLVK